MLLRMPLRCKIIELNIFVSRMMLRMRSMILSFIKRNSLLEGSLALLSLCERALLKNKKVKIKRKTAPVQCLLASWWLWVHLLIFSVEFWCVRRKKLILCALFLNAANFAKCVPAYFVWSEECGEEGRRKRADGRHENSIAWAGNEVPEIRTASYFEGWFPWS